MTDDLKTERVTIMMTPAGVKAVDDWSFQARIRSRGEAIRQLIELGLKAAKGGSGPREMKRQST